MMKDGLAYYKDAYKRQLIITNQLGQELVACHKAKAEAYDKYEVALAKIANLEAKYLLLTTE